MTHPSLEFDKAISAVCDGIASDDETAALHAALRSDDAAMDEYLWQVELHARLAERADIASEFLVGKYEAAPAASRRIAWAMVAAVLMIAAVVAYHTGEPKSRLVTPTTAPGAPRASSPGALAGIYKKTLHFAIAADAPVIVGTGQAEPLELGSELPYSRAGDTLHVWDWSKSPTSRVMRDVRLWPEDVFAVSPDGNSLIWASGKILDLTTGEPSTIDLGGEFYLDNLGDHLRRVQNLQFTPDGRHLALKLSNIVLAKSTHPLRKQDFGTNRTIQIVTYPAGQLTCEFPAGLSLAFSPDGKRVATSIPDDGPRQRIVERSAITGEAVRKYEPPLREFAYEMRYSPDGTRLAVSDAVGELFLWDATTGQLVHRLPLAAGSTAHLGFSPDGKWLAVSQIGKTTVIDVEHGQVTTTFPQLVPGLVRWAADNRTLDVISNVVVGSMTEHPDQTGVHTLYNVLPTLKSWRLPEPDKK